MDKYVHDLCGFVRGENRIGETLDPHDPDYDTRGDEKKALKIKELALAMMIDDNERERLISENADVVNAIIKSGSDVEIKLNESLAHWAECDAERKFE